jgi:hypothetical protein
VEAAGAGDRLGEHRCAVRAVPSGPSLAPAAHQRG